jgi:tetratricopeptide (TPR) repeat protein
MKRNERQRLKDNELASTMASLSHALENRGSQVLYAVLGVVVIGVLVLGFNVYRQRSQAKGQELLAEAMVALNARVVPAGAAGAEGDAPAAAQMGATGTFTTEAAKLAVAIPKLQAAAEAAPDSPAGLTARYHLGGALAAIGKNAEAIATFEEVARRAGPNSLYGRMARMGKADAQARAGQIDAAIASWKELVEQHTSNDLPEDALLVELGRAYVAKGDAAEARKTFQQVVDQHPNSPYAPVARTELDALTS